MILPIHDTEIRSAHLKTAGCIVSQERHLGHRQYQPTLCSPHSSHWYRPPESPMRVSKVPRDTASAAVSMSAPNSPVIPGKRRTSCGGRAVANSHTSCRALTLPARCNRCASSPSMSVWPICLANARTRGMISSARPGKTSRAFKYSNRAPPGSPALSVMRAVSMSARGRSA